MLELPEVCVGKTDYPLKSDASKGMVRSFRNKNKGFGTFRLLDGPPYANGAPHLGHVLNKHIKDALVRAHNLDSNVDWRPGWDCHGLPLELLVENKGFDRKDKELFLSEARKEAQAQVDLQNKVFMEQGWGLDFDNPYKTMDKSFEAGVMRVFADLLDKGVVETRFSAVPWCGKCQSTLSMAESEEMEVNLETWVVPFYLDSGVFGDKECLLSWTTTPWTLPLHKHLVVNPSAMYGQMEKDNELAWVSLETLDKWCEVLGARKTGETKLGSEFGLMKYHTKWMQGLVKADELVLTNAGTGVLHAVPGLSELDTRLGLKNDWGVSEHLNESGLLENSPLESQNGLYASKKSVNEVRPYYESNTWFKQLNQVEKAGHCWRHKTPLLTRPSRQVFLKLESAKSLAEKMVYGMSFTPKSAKNRLLASMKNRPDWCVSRQRTWGVPLALFLDKNTNQPHKNASEWVRKVASLVEKNGVEAWWRLDSKELVGEELSNVERVNDVLDVWFDSGAVPQVLGNANCVVEGTDQHRGWFQSCVWLAALLERPAPFKRVVSHGFVVDGSGNKLSKSKGGDKKQDKTPNWFDLPTDVVRLWSLMGSEGMDKSWSNDSVTMMSSGVMRLRGVMRFLLANLLKENDSKFNPESLPLWDKYWWSKLHDTYESVVKKVKLGYTGEALSELLPFSEEYSAKLMDSWKDRLYCVSEHKEARKQHDHMLRQHLYYWEKLTQVFTPRLRHEASKYLPKLNYVKPIKLSNEEKNEVERVLMVREKLAPLMEELARNKVKPGFRRAVWENKPDWPESVLADALGVGEMGEELHGFLSVEFENETLMLGESNNQLCNRCRRVQYVFSEKYNGCKKCEDNTI